MDKKRVVVFDFDECLGDFTMFYYYDIALNNNITYEFLSKMKFLRPNIQKIFNYLKRAKKIHNLSIILYTNAIYQVPRFITTLLNNKYNTLFDFLITRYLFFIWSLPNKKWQYIDHLARIHDFNKSIYDILKFVKNDKVPIIMFDDKIKNHNKNGYINKKSFEKKKIRYHTNHANANIYLIPTYEYKLSKNYKQKLLDYLANNFLEFSSHDLKNLVKLFSNSRKNNKDYDTVEKILIHLRKFINTNQLKNK